MSRSYRIPEIPAAGLRRRSRLRVGHLAPTALFPYSARSQTALRWFHQTASAGRSAPWTTVAASAEAPDPTSAQTPGYRRPDWLGAHLGWSGRWKRIRSEERRVGKEGRSRW